MSEYDAIFSRLGQGNGGGNEYDDIMQSVIAGQSPASVPPPMSQAPQKRPFTLLPEGWEERANSLNPRDTIGGLIRGAASIGSTLIRPFESSAENDQRRKSVDQFNAEVVGADPNSNLYRTNKLIAELAGTAGAGSVIANGLRMIPGAAAALPNLIPAIESGGMVANGAKGLYGMLTRTAGGAVNGAATAGLVDPRNADEGMMLGGATPALVQGAHAVTKGVGEAWRGQPINPTMAKTASEGIKEGYVVPPNMIAPSWRSRVMESFSGKQATEQLASVRNQEVTEKLTRQALGIADDVPLTRSTLEDLRKTAGKAYAEVSSLSPQAAADLEALKQARNDSQAWFKAYNRSASPNDLAKAKDFRTAAQQLEQSLEQHAAAANRPELIPALRDARKEIAKTFTVERALNTNAGTIDPRVYARLSEKGMPLSDGLDVAGRFASAFPKVNKSIQQIGSPAVHNLNAIMGMGLGSGAGGMAALSGMGAAGAAGTGLAGLAAPFVVPPLARSIMFSGPVQRGLATQPGRGLLTQSIEDLSPLMHRSAGLLTVQ